MPTVRATFDSWAPTYDLSLLQPLLFAPVHRTVIDLLHEHAPRAGRALDVGCGTGQLLRGLQEFVPLVVGVDLSGRMLAAARCSTAGPLFACGGAEQLPFAPGSFEVVTSTLSLRHWRDPDRGVAEIVRVLSTEGVVVVADADLEEEAKRSRRRWHRGKAHGSQLTELLRRWGLGVVDHRLAQARGPVPSIHVLVARRRQAAN